MKMFLESVTCNCPLLKSYTQFSYVQDGAYVYFLWPCRPSFTLILHYMVRFFVHFALSVLQVRCKGLTDLLHSPKCNCKFVCEIRDLKMWALLAGSLSFAAQRESACLQ